jgi:hypothetical protein
VVIYEAFGWKELTMEDRAKQLREMVEHAAAAKLPSGWIDLAQEDPFAADYPTVAAFLLTPGSEGEKGAGRASLTLFVEQGMAKVVLKDRVVNASLWASGKTLEAALVALEAILGSGSPDWRMSPPDMGRRRRI